MKKIGNWNVPDRDINDGKIKEMCNSEMFQCASALNRAFMYVKNFNTAIDVGTWIGDSTWLIGNNFNNVIGFEASPLVYECCIKNLEEKKMDNCRVSNLGLSNKKDTQYLFNKGKTFSGWISSLDLTKEQKNSGILVETVRLDDFNFQNIDFIKIDVDSHEGFLLDGARKFLKDNSSVILIEIKKTIHQNRQIEGMPDCFQILEELGYVMVEKVAKWDYVFIKKEQT